jgi:hypothetical protein
MLTNFNAPVIQPGNYSPISAKGGRRTRRRRMSKKHRKTRARRTRRNYH